jgi:uncharacterized protein YciI
MKKSNRMSMRNTFVVISSAGPKRDLSKGTRQQPLWDEHAAFIDQLVAEGFVLMGGPLVDEDGAMLIVNADEENEVREKLKNDPLDEAWRSQTGEHQTLANLHRCPRVGNVRDTGSARDKISGSHRSRSRANLTSCNFLDQFSVF